MRWMALDHGTKKLGIAFCDALEILSSPFEVWPMEGEASLARLASLAKAEGVEALLVGLPRHHDGTESATAPLARAFGEALAATWPESRPKLRFHAKEGVPVLLRCRSGQARGEARLVLDGTWKTFAFAMKS